ncbi:uncharacterized protein LOC141529015 isoform X2 [Cotesia typhae]|uniref:uncharacterized protein LOC141529015 isoform X2 n=1 Tax=Cotesia typhae TaxID=2053667 RepID=UPI003D68B77E
MKLNTGSVEETPTSTRVRFDANDSHVFCVSSGYGGILLLFNITENVSQSKHLFGKPRSTSSNFSPSEFCCLRKEKKNFNFVLHTKIVNPILRQSIWNACYIV